MVWGGTVEGEWNIVIGTRRFNRSITREREGEMEGNGNKVKLS